jgi:hypothetical protein
VTLELDYYGRLGQFQWFGPDYGFVGY